MKVELGHVYAFSCGWPHTALIIRGFVMTCQCLVDNESSLRKTLRTSLMASRFSVEEARTGEEAFNAVRSHVFDLVLLDINMPGAVGLHACRRIRDFSPEIGIVMITVRDAENDKVNALEAGADDYVTKPFRLRELIARLHAVARRAHRPDKSEPATLRAEVWRSISSVTCCGAPASRCTCLLKNLSYLPL
jgi:DNA-binding response OmpR family regulator